MKRRMLIALSALMVLAMLVTSCAQVPAAAPAQQEVVEVMVEVTRIVEVPAEGGEAPPAAVAQKMLNIVQDRGKLVCGGRTDLVGFGYLDSEGNNIGFDTDLCRAVATAIFGDPTAAEIVPLTAAERGPALQTGEIDLLSRNVTWTSSRDAQWGNFTTVMFYDGQGMMVRGDSGATTLEDLDGATVCVTTGTTTEKNLADAFRERGLEFTAVTFEDTSAVYGAYEDGRCDAATSDKSQLAAVRSGFANPDDHMIMDITMSKEPLTPAVPTGDSQWFDIVKSVMWVLINAEELGVTSANVDEMMNSENIPVRRMLGVEGSFGQEDLGLSTDFAVNVIKAVGNYGEIYDRYMGPDGAAFTLPRGQNELWSKGGLIYAPPLR
ncbi:MAG: amino acid ABC transporter substrate-binding protein [Chloroflexota bacterium]|nr:amino acid ABC transporter substrate-binding protein [Chloroflexota bacterium]